MIVVDVNVVAYYVIDANSRLWVTWDGPSSISQAAHFLLLVRGIT